MLAPADAAGRATSTRQWLASLALSAPARTSAAAAVEAISKGNRKAVASAITRLMETASGQLDASSTTELRELIAELGSA
jgi:excinuclease UvrABC nuclease subunit